MKIALIIIAAVVVVLLVGLLFRITYVMGLKKGFESCYLQVHSGALKIRKHKPKKTHLLGYKGNLKSKRS